jgi:hypothetical protein
VAAVRTPREHHVDLGSGRIAASETEAPNMLANLARSGCAVVQRDTATEPYAWAEPYYAFGLIWFRPIYFDLKSLMIHFFWNQISPNAS